MAIPSLQAAAPATSSEPYNSYPWPLFFQRIPIHTNQTRTLTLYEGDLIATRISSVHPAGGINQVGRWNGNEWLSMGDPDIVMSCLTTFNHQLMAGGGAMFRNPDAGPLARWDGTRWVNIAPHLNGRIYSMVVWENQLVIGGKFQVEGKPNTRNLIIWDGKSENESSWHVLPSTGLGGGLNSIKALAVHNGDLYVGGIFAEIDGIMTPNIARYDGKKWHPVGKGTDGPVTLLASNNNHLFVAGQFTKAGHENHPVLAQWDGTRWESLGDAFMDFDSPSLVSEIKSMKIRQGKLIIGGDFTNPGHGDVKGLATWDGNQWLAPTGTLNFVRDFEFFQEQFIAIGSGYHVYPKSMGVTGDFNIASWTNQRWQWLHVPGPGLFSRYTKISEVDGDIIGCGRLGPLSPDQLEIWQKDHWKVLADSSSTGVFPFQVQHMESSGKSLYIHGYEGDSTLGFQSVVLKWDGHKVEQLGKGITPPLARDSKVVVTKSSVHLVGRQVPSINLLGGMPKKRDPSTTIWRFFTWKNDVWQAETDVPDFHQVSDAVGHEDGVFIAVTGVREAQSTVRSQPEIWRWWKGRWELSWSHESGYIPFFSTAGSKLWAGLSNARIADQAVAPLLNWDGHKWNGFGEPLLGLNVNDAGETRSAGIKSMTVYQDEVVISARFRDLASDMLRDQTRNLVWREDRWIRLPYLLPEVVGMLAQDDFLWLSQSASGHVSQLPLTFFSGDLKPGLEIAKNQMELWKSQTPEREKLNNQTPPEPEWEAIADAGLPYQSSTSNKGNSNVRQGMNDGSPGWFGLPPQWPPKPEMPRDEMHSDNWPADSSLSPLLKKYEKIVLNYRCQPNTEYLLSFAWRIQRRSGPVRDDRGPKVGITWKIIEGDHTSDMTTQTLTPIHSSMNKEGFSRARLGLKASENSHLITLKITRPKHRPGHSVEIEDFKIEALSEPLPDRYDEIALLMTTRFRRADGTHLPESLLPAREEISGSRQQDAGLWQNLRKAGVWSDFPDIAPEYLESRSVSLASQWSGIEELLVNKELRPTFSGRLPGNILYLRGRHFRTLIGSTGEKKPVFSLRNLDANTKIILDLREQPRKMRTSSNTGNDHRYWHRLMQLAGFLTDHPVTIMGYQGEDGFIHHPELAGNIKPAADGTDRVLLEAFPQDSWNERGPIAVLTNQWTNINPLLALKGRPGVRVFGETTTILPRPWLYHTFLNGQEFQLKTGVFSLPDGANILVEGIAPDVDIEWDSTSDQVFIRALEWVENQK